MKSHDIRVAIYAKILEQQAKENTIGSQLEALQERVANDGCSLEEDFASSTKATVERRSARPAWNDCATRPMRAPLTACTAFSGSPGPEVRLPDSACRGVEAVWRRTGLFESDHRRQSRRRLAVANAGYDLRVRTGEGSRAKSSRETPRGTPGTRQRRLCRPPLWIPVCVETGRRGRSLLSGRARTRPGRATNL